MRLAAGAANRAPARMPARRALPATVLAGWALLMLAWAMANPPFASPDEADHYRRAIGLGAGELVGEPAPESPGGSTDKQRAWNSQLAHRVTVPAGLAPPDPGCYVLTPEQSAACLDQAQPPQGEVEQVSQVGNYPPLPYLLPAATMRASSSAEWADRVGRLTLTLACLALLGLALALLWSPSSGVLSLLGPLAAVTPMVIFTGASLGGSGMEICAAVAFFAAILRVTRQGEADPPWTWYALGGAGAVLALTRTLGPGWIALGALLLAPLGVRPLSGRLKRGLTPSGRAALVAVVVIAAAIVLSRVWEAAYGPDPMVGAANLRGVIGDSLRELWRSASELVGGFGHLEYDLPLWLVLGWFAAIAALLAVAARVSGAGGRLALSLTLAAAVIVPVALHILVIRHTGFGLQGRYVLPLLVLVPLLAGELVHRNRERALEAELRALALAVPLVAGAGQLAAWYLHGRRSAVGVDGSLAFPFDSHWDPPLGWLPWLAVAGAGALLLAQSARPRAPLESRGRGT